MKNIMAEKQEVKVETFSTKRSIYKGEGDDRVKTGETPEVAIPTPDWLQKRDAFVKEFADDPKIAEKSDGYHKRGLTVPCQTHLRNSVKPEDWNEKNLIAALKTFKPSLGKEKIDHIEKARREMEKQARLTNPNAKITREDMLDIIKRYAKK